MAGRVQEPVTFEDVAVYLSRAEWDAVVEEQRDLYRSVMRDNYELLTSLGYPGPKPDVLYRMERGEEPWVCTPQSPARWDGPSSSSPGRNGDVSWLEEPPSGWWPGAGGSPVLEERAQTPCHAGGRCTHWRLRTRRLLNKFTCLGGRSKLPAEAAGGGAGPEESQDRARMVFGPGKEGEVEDNVARSRGFSPHPVVEKQNKEADPREHLRGDPRERSQRSAQESRCALGDGTFLWRNNKLSAADLNEIILKDHCYFTMRQTQLLLCTSCLCFLREHDYCRNREVVVSALQDHEYCQVQRIPYQGRVNQTVRLSGKARAVLRRLARRKSLVRRIIKKAKRIMWRCKSCVNTALEFPQGSSSAGCPEPAVPPAKAKGNPTAGTRGAFCPPAEQGAVPPQPQSKGRSQGVTSEASHALLVSFEPAAALPPSNAAVEVKRDAPRPEVSARCEARGMQLAQSRCATQNVEGHALHSNPISLRDAYKMVMRTVDQMLDSICQNFERGGYAQCKDVWPVVIQIDS